MIEHDFSRISAILMALLLFGVFYNALVALADKHGYLEGFTWLAVCVGCAATLLGVALIDWHCALITLLAFMASGTPMASGAIWRYVRMRKAEQDRVRQTTTLAE